MTVKFDELYQQALARKGGEAEVLSRLPTIASAEELTAMGDDRYLAVMTKCIFRAGFVWQVIDKKWPDFETAFSGFVPRYWQQVPPERLEALGRDPRIVRNMQKIMTVPANAQMICDVAEQHGSFGAFLAQWPHDDQVGLLLWLKKHGARLGGASAQYLLRMVGWDGFITSADVVTVLKNYRLIDANPDTAKGLKQIQAVFNAWQQQSGLPYSHLSRIVSLTLDAH